MHKIKVTRHHFEGISMNRTVSVDDQGRIIVVCKLPFEHNEQTTAEKHEEIKHLRRVQSVSFIGRSAIRMADFFRGATHRAA
jgi:hypothetical protein